MDDIVEAIERATFSAVPPQALGEREGWLLGLDAGTVGRAHSTVPLRHLEPPRLQLAQVEADYAERGLQAVFRLPVLEQFEAAAQELRGAGYSPRQPTIVQVASVRDLVRAEGYAVLVEREPDDAWARLFLDVCEDAHDARSRMEILRRGRDSVYASIRLQGEVAAVGVGCAANGWCGMHGMRTAAAWRGRGMAGAILGALARHGLAAGAGRAFLQVEQANTKAQSAYRRAGFTPAWTYAYWRRGP